MSPAKSPLRVVSLFSGAGGFDLGFHMTSRFKTIMANELKDAPAETISRNFGLEVVDTQTKPSADMPPTVILGDIEEVKFAYMKDSEPEVLLGGPPCQDFSIVKGPVRKGIEVKRGKLYSHFVRALVTLQPRFFVFENVPGLVSSNRGAAYKAILDDFSNLKLRWKEIQEVYQVDNGKELGDAIGFKVLFNDIVDAANLGVPQMRRRLIIIGVREDLAGKFNLFEFERLRQEMKARLSGNTDGSLFSKYPLTPLEVFEGKPLVDLREKYRAVMEKYKGIWRENSSQEAKKWKSIVWDKLTLDPVQDYLRLNGIEQGGTGEIEEAMAEHEDVLKLLGYSGRHVSDTRPGDGSEKIIPESEHVLDRMRHIPPDKNHLYVRDTKWHVEGRGLSLIYRRAHPLKPAPTIVAFGGGGTWGYHYERKRGKLTNRERARIQTFTDDFVFEGNRGEVRGQLGEAVPPLMAYRIAKALLEVRSILEG